jgi:agmatinase
VASAPQPIGERDALRVPRFAGPLTFARLPTLDHAGRADIAVLGHRRRPAHRVALAARR